MRLLDRLEQRPVLASIVIALVSLVSTAVLATASVFIPALGQDISVALWAVWALVLLLGGLALLVWWLFHRVSGELAVATAERDRAKQALEEATELEYSEGAYYRQRDKQRHQPFCVRCFDSRRALNTMRKSIDWDGPSHQIVYHCQECDRYYTWVPTASLESVSQ